MRLGSESNDRCPHRQIFTQIEGRRDIALYPATHLRLLLRVAHCRQVTVGQRQRAPLSNDLTRLASDIDIAGAQNLMPVEKSCQRCLERHRVELPLDEQAALSVVVRATAFELIDEPQSLLRVGE